MMHPWWLLGLLALPAYWWLRREEARPLRRTISSLLLWAAVPPAQEERAKAWERRTDRILALELAGMGLVVLALAGPARRSGDAGARPWVLYVDRSASLAATDAQGRSRGERVQEALAAWLDGRPGGERFHVLTGAGEHAGSLDAAAAKARVAQADPRAREERRADGVAAAWALARTLGGRAPLVVTDQAPPEGETAWWLARGGPAENAGIVAFAAERTRAAGSDRLELLARVRNAGARTREATLRVPGAEPVALRLAAGADEEVLLTLPWSVAETELHARGCLPVRLEPADALADDDVARLAATPAAAPVWRIGPENRELDRALEAVFPGRVRRMEDAAAAGEWGLYVYDRVVPAQRPPGPCLLLAPAGDLAGVLTVGAEAEAVRERRFPGAADPLVAHAHLDVARIHRARPIRFAAGVPVETLLVADGGAPLVARVGGGSFPLVVVAFDTAWRGETGDSDWAQLPGFPIFFANVASAWGLAAGPEGGVACGRPGDLVPGPGGTAWRPAEAGCFRFASSGEALAPGTAFSEGSFAVAANLVSARETDEAAAGAEFTRLPGPDEGAEGTFPREVWRGPLGLGIAALAAAAVLEARRRRAK